MIYCDENVLVSRIAAIVVVELGGAHMVLRENTGSENSILVCSQPSIYLDWPAKEFLFGRIKTSGKSAYLSFSSQYADLFKLNNIAFTTMKSQPSFIRIEIDAFNKLLEDEPCAHSIFSKILLNLINVPAFGCCSLYVECSDSNKCISTDHLYSLGCQYKVNLESGRIFYGKNKNI